MDPNDECTKTLEEIRNKKKKDRKDIMKKTKKRY